ncbi:hypothetical protein BN3658_00955 [Coriobacteriaceae bacterium CHKCI002]|nr:hypothetical protein BN3658_00955 [Coriobacteriaceae bacterium CHKCI002]
MMSARTKGNAPPLGRYGARGAVASVPERKNGSMPTMKRGTDSDIVDICVRARSPRAAPARMSGSWLAMQTSAMGSATAGSGSSRRQQAAHDTANAAKPDARRAATVCPRVTPQRSSVPSAPFSCSSAIAYMTNIEDAIRASNMTA